jgi:hypothetical protein
MSERVTNIYVRPVFLIKAEVDGREVDLDPDTFGKTWTILYREEDAQRVAAEIRRSHGVPEFP